MYNNAFFIGTFQDFEDTDYNPRYLLSLVQSESDNSFGVCIVEATTHFIYLDEFKDDKLNTNLRTILKKLKPAEVVYDKANVSEPVKNMIKQISNPYVSRMDCEFNPIKEELEKITGFFKDTNREIPVLI